MRASLLIAFLCLQLPLLAQTFYGLREDPGTSIYHLTSVDAATTTITSIGTIAGLTGYVAPGTATINTSTNEYIFRGFDGGGTRLYAIDIITGAMNSNPPLSGIIVGLEYDCITDTIYALHEDSVGTYHLVAFDPGTPNIISLGTIPGVSGYVGGTFTLDAHSGRYHFVGLDGPNFKLYSIDIHTGAVLASPNFPDNVHAMRYSCVSDSIYGRWEDQQSGTYYLVAIDAMSGNYTTIGAMAGIVSGNIADAAALDASTGNYAFLGYTGAPIHLITADVGNASVVYSQAVTYTNFTGMEAVNCCPAVPLVPPVASFSTSYTDTICVGDTVQFATTSTNATSIQWSFPGGSLLGAQSDSAVSVLYNTAGVWDVTLSATGPDGMDDTTATALIVVSTCDSTPLPDPPTVSVSFAPATICAGDSVEFTATTTDATSVQWTFQGGTPLGSTSANVVWVQYATAGSYGYSVTVTGLGGSTTDNGTNVITVESCVTDPPTISISHSAGDTICLGDTVSYLDASQNRTLITWNFAGGSPLSSTDTAVSVVYSTPGTFTVDLVVTGPGGNADSTFSVLVADCSTGISDAPITANWRVWPNPTSGDVWLQARTAGKHVRYELCSVTGAVLGAGVVPASGSVLVAMDGLPTGVYFLRVADVADLCVLLVARN